MASPTNVINERGYFWWHDTVVPKENFAPTEGAHGNLKIDSEGAIELELDTELTEDRSLLLNSARTINQNICGLLKSGNRRVLLSKLHIVTSQLSNVSFSHETFGAEQCLIYQNSSYIKEVTSINQLQINLLGFDQWFGFGSISVASTKRSTTVQYKAIPKQRYKVSDGTIEFSFELTKPYDQKHAIEVNLKEQTILTYKKRYTATESVIDDCLRIEEFFLILTNHERSLEWPTIQINRERIRAKFYFRRGSILTEDIKFHTCWIKFSDIENDFGRHFDNWAKKRRDFGPGFYYYLGLRRGLTLYTEHRFMNSIWGLESLHRNLASSQTYLKIEAKVSRILDKIENQRDKRWLQAQLRFKVEPSLKDRLHLLFSSLPLSLNDGLLKTFSGKCADYRNDLSHFGTARKNISYLEFLNELHVLGSALELLYHFKILQEIGISNEYIERLFKQGFGSFRIKQVLWSAGLLDEDPQKAAVEAAKASVEATKAAMKKKHDENQSMSKP